MPGRSSRLAAWLVVGLCGVLIVGTAVLSVLGLGQPAPDPSGFTGLGGWVFRLAFVPSAVAGALIVFRAPGNAIGPLFLAAGLLGLASDFTYQYADLGLDAPGGPVPGSAEAAVLQNVTGPATFGTLGLALLLFPDGRLANRRLRWAAAVPMASIALLMFSYAVRPGPVEFFEEADNPWGVPALDAQTQVLGVLGWLLMPLGVALGGVVTWRRFHRSTGPARQQLKWVAFAGAVAGTLVLLNLVSWFVPFEGMDDLRIALSGVALAVFPASVGVAILRYRLYDVDVVINRTLVYSGLTAALAATYLLVVLLLQVTLRPVTRSSDLAVAGSTLVVAALFRPARAGIQRIVDRRFYRSRYDAAQTLTRFTVHLRDQLDADALADEICRVVEDTVQPTSVTLWTPRRTGGPSWNGS